MRYSNKVEEIFFFLHHNITTCLQLNEQNKFNFLCTGILGYYFAIKIYEEKQHLSACVFFAMPAIIIFPSFHYINPRRVCTKIFLLIVPSQQMITKQQKDETKLYFSLSMQHTYTHTHKWRLLDDSRFCRLAFK